MNQKFKITFDTSPDLTIFPQKKSGNPGYFDSFPLKIGYLKAGDESNGAPVQVYQDGLQITGANSHGRCYASDAFSSLGSAIVDFEDPVVNFKEDITYGCSVSHTLASLKTFCTGGTASTDTVKNLEIFRNLEQFKKYGKFGNANLYYSKDWNDVTEDSSFSSDLASMEWVEETQTCKIYSSALIKIDYTFMGIDQNP